GANLFSSDPGARQSFNAMRGNAVIGADANHDLFEIANVPMHIASVGTQIEDRISDDLAGAVICHVAAATGFMHLDALHRKLPLGGRDMRTTVTPDAESNHRRMLKQEQQIGHAAGTTLFNDVLLQFERLAVGTKPEAAPFENPSPRRPGVSRRWRERPPGVAERPP